MSGKNNTVPNVNKEKHKPIRMCTSCRKRSLKGELLRIVRVKTAESNSIIKLDKTQRLMGRGMYICYSKECFNKLKKDAKKNKKNFLGNVNDENLFAEIERALEVIEG